MAKLDFSKCKIRYRGYEYDAAVKGDDEKGADGLWDLAGAFAENVCDQLDGDVHFNDDLDGAYMIIQEDTYNLLKHTVPATVKTAA
jgi:hypothetical protein